MTIARLMQSETIVISDNCFSTFHHEDGLTELNEIDPITLAAACDRHGAVVTNAQKLVDYQEGLFRAGYLPISDLVAVINQSEVAGAAFVKVFMGIDAQKKQFVFCTPMDSEGKALNIAEERVALTCVQFPPCTQAVNDKYLR